MNYISAVQTMYHLEVSFKFEAELWGTNPKEIRITENSISNSFVAGFRLACCRKEIYRFSKKRNSNEYRFSPCKRETDS